MSFTSDVMLIHPVGQHIALYNVETKSCMFLQKHKDVVEVRFQLESLFSPWCLPGYCACLCSPAAEHLGCGVRVTMLMTLCPPNPVCLCCC